MSAVVAAIGLEAPDGSVRATVCRSDGEVSKVGRRLMLHWRCPEKVARLVEHGAVESLGVDFEGPDELRTIPAAPEKTGRPFQFNDAEGFWHACAPRQGQVDAGWAYLLSADGRWLLHAPDGERSTVAKALMAQDREFTRRMPDGLVARPARAG